MREKSSTYSTSKGKSHVTRKDSPIITETLTSKIFGERPKPKKPQAAHESDRKMKSFTPSLTENESKKFEPAVVKDKFSSSSKMEPKNRKRVKKVRRRDNKNNSALGEERVQPTTTKKIECRWSKTTSKVCKQNNKGAHKGLQLTEIGKLMLEERSEEMLSEFNLQEHLAKKQLLLRKEDDNFSLNKHFKDAPISKKYLWKLFISKRFQEGEEKNPSNKLRCLSSDGQHSEDASDTSNSSCHTKSSSERCSGRSNLQRNSDNERNELQTISSCLQANNSANNEETKFDYRLARKLRRQFKLENVQQHYKAILMSFCIFLIIVLCWCPIAINFIIGEFFEVPSLAYVCFTVLAWTNSCVNIFIYAGLNIRFRKAYMFLILGRRSRHTRQQEKLSPAMAMIIRNHYKEGQQ